MKNYLAIDIALLPPIDVMSLAIKINKDHGPEFILNKTDHLPHITLSQAILDKKDLKEAEAKLNSIASRFKPLQLKARIVPNFIEPYKSNKLYSLHKEVMKEFIDLVSYDVKEEYFFEAPIRKKSLEWVRNFQIDSAYSNFYPHLTLGITEPIEESMPDIDFTVSRLAICHLGDYNTCRKVLIETSLGKDSNERSAEGEAGFIPAASTGEKL